MDKEARYGEASALSPVAEPSTLAHNHSHASSMHNLEDAIIEEIGEGEDEEGGEGGAGEEGAEGAEGEAGEAEEAGEAGEAEKKEAKKAGEGEGSEVDSGGVTNAKQKLKAVSLDSKAHGLEIETADGSSEFQESAFAPASVPLRPLRGDSVGRYSPLPWDGYFDKSEEVAIPGTQNVFNIYTAGTEGPVVFCLHGGGYSGLSFALVASKMKHKVRVVSLDMRAHGQTRTSDDSDLSSETLSADVLAVIDALYGKTPPSIILIGHSMGGAIAVRVAAKRLLPTLAGVVVVDVVEGTALASLVHMQRILSSRQSHFKTIDKAIEWSVKGGGTLRNIESARVSVPSTLKFDANKDWDGSVTLWECPNCGRYVVMCPAMYGSPHCTKAKNIGEAGRPYLPVTGLYEGLSECFLSCPVGKLLMLAGTDRLDRSLTIGQMQGKFQMIVIRHSGHAIQEDEPEEFSTVVLGFISRNRIGAHGLEIPKVWKPAPKS